MSQSASSAQSASRPHPPRCYCQKNTPHTSMQISISDTVFREPNTNKKPRFQNCSSTPSWVPLAGRARLGAPDTGPGRTHSEERPKTESPITGPWGDVDLRMCRLETCSSLLEFSSRAWQPSASGSSFLLQTGILPSVMYPHFLCLFLHGAVSLPRKKVKREQRHMVFLLRLTPTC